MQIYMNATQMIRRAPMSVFLSPDLKPFYCGTYFSPSVRHGGSAGVRRRGPTPGTNRREQVEEMAGQLTEILPAGQRRGRRTV